MKHQKGFSAVIILLLVLGLILLVFIVISIVPNKDMAPIDTVTEKEDSVFLEEISKSTEPEKESSEKLYVNDLYYFAYPSTFNTKETGDKVDVVSGPTVVFSIETVYGNLAELTNQYTPLSEPEKNLTADDYAYFEEINDTLYYHTFTQIDETTWIKRSYSADTTMEDSDLQTILLSFTPKLNVDSWNEHSSPDLGVSIKYPERWDIKIGTDYVKGAVVLTTPSEKPSERSRGVEIIIGDWEVYSTSGGVCANRYCEERLNTPFVIEGATYFSSVIRSSWPAETDFEHITGYVSSGTDGILPIYYSAHDTKQLREIRQIVQTLEIH